MFESVVILDKKITTLFARCCWCISCTYRGM